MAVTKILHILEFTSCNRFQHALTAQGVMENHDPVEPVLNLLSLDQDATLIEGADGLDYPIACRKDIVESRCLPFGPPQCIRMLGIIDDLILVPNGPTTFFHDEILDPAVGAWGDFPLPLKIKLAELGLGDDVSATSLADVFQAVVLNDPTFGGEGIFFETPPPHGVLTIEQVDPSSFSPSLVQRVELAIGWQDLGFGEGANLDLLEPYFVLMMLEDNVALLVFGKPVMVRKFALRNQLIHPEAIQCAGNDFLPVEPVLDMVP